MSGSKTAFLAATILVGAVLLAGAASAAGGPGGGRGHGPGPGPGFGPGGGLFGLGPAARELDLTVTQREQLRELAEREWQAGLSAVVDAAREAREALRAAIENPAATEEQIRAAAAATTVPDANLAVAHHKLYLAARALLTAEQTAVLEKLQAERNARRERRQESLDAWLGGPPPAD